jgi:hypothetical protein
MVEGAALARPRLFHEPRHKTGHATSSTGLGTVDVVDEDL